MISKSGDTNGGDLGKGQLLWSLQYVRLERLAELKDRMDGQAEISLGQSFQDSSLPL